MASSSQRIRSIGPEKRQRFIIDVFVDSFHKLISLDPDAWRGKFRKMAATPFAFYRGSAVLFYADIADDEDAFLDEKTSRVWIQGDLHAENFGTYMNSAGVLVFDVNDFDEAYVAPFTWDIKRLAASLALIGYEKALSDDEIRQVLETLGQSYVKQVTHFAQAEQTRDFALKLANTKGKLLEVLQQARLKTRVGLLDRETTIENYERRFIYDKNSRPLEPEKRAKVEVAFEQYFTSIPSHKRFAHQNYRIKDAVVRRGMGIGSAGLPSFTLLIEGRTEALENDIIVYMKQSQRAAPSWVIKDAAIKDYFQHDGHRTVLSQRALQAYADPWLGYTTYEGAGQLVAEVSPYTNDLEWGGINQLEDILQLVEYLGQAVAKIHCVSDADSDQTLVPFSTDKAIYSAFKGREGEFVEAIADFGQEYGEIVRNDHRLFIDAFRNHMFRGL